MFLSCVMFDFFPTTFYFVSDDNVLTGSIVSEIGNLNQLTLLDISKYICILQK